MQKERKALVPYQKQPPSFVAPNRKPSINKGLLFSSAIPSEVWYGRTGIVRPTLVAAGTNPAYSKTTVLGKTVNFTSTSVSEELEAISCISPAGQFSVMVGFNITTASVFQGLISCGGSNTGNGWGICVNASNQLVLLFGGLATYTFTNLTISTGVNYFVVVTVDEFNLVINAYLINKNTNSILTQSVVITVTMAIPAKPLTIGGLYDGTAYSNHLAGHVGSFAVWDKTLTNNQSLSLLSNPYQIWSVSSLSKTSVSNIVLTGVSSTGAVGTITAAASNITLALSNVVANTSVGTVNDGKHGVSTSGLVGTVSGVNSARTLAGTSSTVSVGFIIPVPDLSPVLQGQFSSGSVGSVASNTDSVLTGVSETSQIGDLTTDNSFIVSGTSSTAGCGSVTTESSFPNELSTVVASGSVGTLGTGDVEIVILGIPVNVYAGFFTVGGESHGVSSTGFVGSIALVDNPRTLTSSAISTAIQNITASTTHSSPILPGNQSSGLVGTVSSVDVVKAISGNQSVAIADNLSNVQNPEVFLSGVRSNSFVGTLNVINSSKIVSLIGVTSSILVGKLTSFGGIPAFGHSGQNTPHKFKKRPVQIDFAVQWTMSVMGNEEKYFGPKIRMYYPSIREDELSNTIHNIRTTMGHYFTEHPKLSKQEISIKEGFVIKYWSLIALHTYNASVLVDEKPYRPGLLG